MDDNEWLADRFEEHRARLRAVAYRMLGSLTEADDAVQDTWLRLSRSEASEVENLGGWLTTVVARVSLNMLRSRNVRREESFGVHVPDAVISPVGELQPEEEALLADSVGLALLVVLDTLTPAERLAFVLHDMFELPFEEIAPMVGRTPAAARQLASRARRRVKGAEVPVPDADLARQRDVVDAFFLAARGGDFDALVAVLHPDVVARVGSDGLSLLGSLHGTSSSSPNTRALRPTAASSAEDQRPCWSDRKTLVAQASAGQSRARANHRSNEEADDRQILSGALRALREVPAGSHCRSRGRPPHTPLPDPARHLPALQQDPLMSRA